jgi:hypothetical protein
MGLFSLRTSDHDCSLSEDTHVLTQTTLTVATKTLSINSSTMAHSPSTYVCFSSDREAIGWIPENCDREVPTA